MAIFGVSDGGAHTKFFTGGRYSTEALIKIVRDNNLMSLEEAAFPPERPSCDVRRIQESRHPGRRCGGRCRRLRSRQARRFKPMEIVHDFPGGEWRRVQRAEGYHTIMVNGEVTFEDDKCTGATPGRLLRHGGN